MNHFLIVTNSTKDPDGTFTEKVCRFLKGRGVSFCLESEFTGEKAVDCILVLGGDGTVLQAAGRYLSLDVPFLGINLGTLGYLAEIEKANWEEALTQILAGNYSIEQRMMIDGTKNAGSGSVHTALNDIVIARSGALRIMNYDVRVNGQFLSTYNADGIIVCTPTGSTAYNLSAGGPVVEPGAEMMVLTPICPHQMNIRPIVLSANDTVEISIGTTRPGTVLEGEADFDGNERVDLETGDTITIRKSVRTTKLMKLENRSFLETLHRKMS